MQKNSLRSSLGLRGICYSWGIYGFWHSIGFILLGERRRIECAVYFPSPLSLSSFSLEAFNKISRTFRHSFILLAFIWMLLGRTGASAVIGEKRPFLSIPPFIN